jgi:hypothetical protein
MTLYYCELLDCWLTYEERKTAEHLLRRYSANYVREYIVDLRRQTAKVQRHEKRSF